MTQRFKHAGEDIKCLCSDLYAAGSDAQEKHNLSLGFSVRKMMAACGNGVMFHTDLVLKLHSQASKQGGGTIRVGLISPAPSVEEQTEALRHR